MKLVVLICVIVVPISNEYLTCSVRPSMLEYIALKEGFYTPGTLPYKYHNPGALRTSKGFLRFDNDEQGWASLERTFNKRRKEGNLKKAWAYLQVQ